MLKHEKRELTINGRTLEGLRDRVVRYQVEVERLDENRTLGKFRFSFPSKGVAGDICGTREGHET